MNAVKRVMAFVLAFAMVLALCQGSERVWAEGTEAPVTLTAVKRDDKVVVSLMLNEASPDPFLYFLYAAGRVYNDKTVFIDLCKAFVGFVYFFVELYGLLFHTVGLSGSGIALSAVFRLQIEKKRDIRLHALHRILVYDPHAVSEASSVSLICYGRIHETVAENYLSLPDSRLYHL